MGCTASSPSDHRDQTEKSRLLPAAANAKDLVQTASFAKTNAKSTPPSVTLRVYRVHITLVIDLKDPLAGSKRVCKKIKSPSLSHLVYISRTNTDFKTCVMKQTSRETSKGTPDIFGNRRAPSAGTISP
jgi:hypothetical protein